MRILYVVPYLPSLIRVRPYNLLRGLAGLGHRISLLAATGTSSAEKDAADALQDLGIDVNVFPVSLGRSLQNCLRALPTREPLQAVYAYHPEMEQKLACLLSERIFDVVHIEHLRAARLVRAVASVPTVYDSVDCISLLFEQTARFSSQLRSRLMARLDLARTRRYEARVLTKFNHVVVTSQRDHSALQNLAHQYLQPQEHAAPITVVTNGVDLEYFQPMRPTEKRDPHTVVFTGKMSYHANVSGVLYFAREVLPRIWDQNPDVRFQIVGQKPPETVQQLAADDRIQVTGYVDDLRPYLAKATVAVCPVPYAVGVQNKVLEAMAMGTPVVCNSAAFAGLQAKKGDDLLVADDPLAFASYVLQLVSDEALRQRMHVSERRYVETNHNWTELAARLESIYRAVTR